MNNPTETRELNNLTKLLGEVMNLSVYFMDKGETETSDKVYELVDNLLTQSSYDQQTFLETGKLVVSN